MLGPYVPFYSEDMPNKGEEKEKKERGGGRGILIKAFFSTFESHVLHTIHNRLLGLRRILDEPSV
jgi:hypothetical protein